MGPGRLTGMNDAVDQWSAVADEEASMGPGRLTGMNAVSACTGRLPPGSLQWGPVD